MSWDIYEMYKECFLLLPEYKNIEILIKINDKYHPINRVVVEDEKLGHPAKLVLLPEV